MSFKEKIVDIGNGIKDKTRDILDEGEVRSKTPEFQTAIQKEYKEAGIILENLGKNTLNDVLNIVYRAPTKIFLKALLPAWDSILKEKDEKKYTFKTYRKEILDLFIGKDGIAHSTLKVAYNAIKYVGKGVKIGIREIFKI